MFSKIIALIRRGVLPPPEQLQTILNPAMVKKTGVMQQPRPCWSNDPKINPDAGHMLWAAILLEDQELISMATAMLFVEQGNELEVLTSGKARALLIEKGADLQALAPTPEFKGILTKIINQAADSICRE